MRIVAPALLAVLVMITDSAATADEAQIDEVLVTATRRSVSIGDVTSALTLVDAASMMRDKLVTDAFTDQPGAFLQQTTPGQGAAIIRGLKGSAILHLVDGMRLNNAIFRSAPTQYFALVPVSSAGRIELIRGTPASLYGSDAVGGVVQLVTHKPQFDNGDGRFRGDVSAAFDSAELGRAIRATLDAGNDTLATSMGAEYLETGDRRIGGGERVAPSAYRAAALRGFVKGRTGDRREWSIDAHYLEQPDTPRVDELVPGFGQAQPSSSEYFFRPNRRAFLHGEYRLYDAMLGLDWDFDLAWQRIDDDFVTRDYESAERRYEDNRSDLYGATVSASRVDEAGSWVAGAELYLDRVASARRGEDLADGQVVELVPRFPDGSEVRQAALYVNGEQRVGDRHVLSGGMRFSHEEVTLPATPASDAASVRVSDVAGDVGWILDVGEAWQVAVNAGFGFRAPNVFDLGTLGERPGNRFNIPNTELDSEHVVQFDAGLRYRGNSGEAQVTAYTMRYDDRITSVPTGDVTPSGRQIVQSVNTARSTIRGLEFGASFEAGERVVVSGVLNYTRGEESVAGSPAEPADRIPPLGGRVTVEYMASDALTISGYAAFADRQDRLSARDIDDIRIDPNGTPGWGTCGATVAWDDDNGWQVTLGLDNAFDKRYRSHGSGIDAPGRSVNVRIRRSWR